MKINQTILWLLSFVRPLSKRMAVAITLGILSNLAVIAIPVTGARQLVAVMNGQTDGVRQAFYFMLGCGVFRGIARYSEQYLNHDIAFRLLAFIRDEIFSTLRKLGPARLADRRSGDMVAAITTDVEALEVFFAHTISPVFIAIGTSIVTVGFLGTYSLLLAVILLCGQLIVGVGIPLWSYHSNKDTGAEYQKSFSDLNQNVIESIESLQDIDQYQQEKFRLDSLKKAGRKLNVQYKKRLQQSSILQITAEFVLILTAVMILFISTRSGLPEGTVAVATVLSLSSFGAVLALNGLAGALVTTLASGERLRLLVEEEPAVSFTDVASAPFVLEDVIVKDVSYAYPDAEKPGEEEEEKKSNVLDDLSLALKKGRITGIGGESGSGKSTLIKLMMRYWDPDSGSIRLENMRLNEIDEASLHQLEGVMEQSTFIFQDSIASNIALGKAEATDEEIEEAAKNAAIHDWIMTLPEGYDTVIGGQARTVSEGERQRIAMARMFLHDAPFLLLDEPTSNLDYLNEQGILTTLKAGVSDKVILLVSHRGTTLSFANKVYVMNKGKLNQIRSS